tara:strand:+ start:359 stop:508 length:150 start_codon:yes stop_codon:yes gene_type:complete
MQEAVDKDHTGLLVELVLHGIAAKRNLNHHVDLVGRISPRRDLTDIHAH